MNRSLCADQVGKGVFLAEGIHVKRQDGLHKKMWWMQKCDGCREVPAEEK